MISPSEVAPMDNIKFICLVLLLTANIVGTFYLAMTIEDYLLDADARLSMVCGYTLGNE
jgi:hypothetical protein